MLQRISKIVSVILVLIIIGAACYLFYFNRESVTVHFGPDKSATAPMAVVLLSTLGFGVLLTALVAFTIALKGYFRERGLVSRERKRDTAYQKMLVARGYVEAKDWDRAKEAWQKILKLDKKDVISRVEIAHCLYGQGELRESLKMLDSARTISPDNAEVLINASRLNRELGNKTAALDNLALLLYHYPNQHGARLARDISFEIGRVDDALEYQTLLENTGELVDEDAKASANIKLAKVLKDTADDDSDSKIKALKRLVKELPTYGAARYHLAMLEQQSGNNEEAARLLLKASKESNDPSFWQEASSLWIKAQHPDRAIAAAKTGANSTSGLPRVLSELALIKLYLDLNMADAAKESLDAFDALVKEQQVKLSQEQQRSKLVLLGRYHNSVGAYRESARIWQDLLDPALAERIFVQKGASHGANKDQRMAPTPELSTP